MKSSIKLYVKDMIKNPSYLFIVIGYLCITINSIFKVKSSILESDMPEEVVEFTFQYLFFTLIIGYFLFLVMTGISSIVVSDKLSGRCEMLLANKVSIELLMRNYTITIFFLCVLPIFIYAVVLLGIYSFSELNEIMDKAWNVGNLFFVLGFFIFSLSLIKMIIYICLILKRVEIIRSILSFSSIGFLFIVMAPVNFLCNQGWILTGYALALAISAILIVLSVIFLLVILVMKKNYSNERVVLSFRQ